MPRAKPRKMREVTYIIDVEEFRYVYQQNTTLQLDEIGFNVCMENS